MLIRDAHPDEYSEIGDIRVGAYLADGFLSPESGYAPRLRELGTDDLDPVLVAVADDGALTGTVMLQVWPHGGEVVKGPDEAEIRALAVRPEARGAGVGQALLAAVIDRAALLGIQHLVLLTQPEMKAAHRLYGAAGFTRMPERDWSPEPDVRLLAYGLVLDAGGIPRGASCTRAGRLGLAEARRAPVPGRAPVRQQEEQWLAVGEALPEVSAVSVPDEAWLLDVREDDEWAAGHAPDARHIPVGELGARTAEIPQDAPIYVICRSGVRSARVTQALNGAGWQAVNVAGGMQDWAAAGRPMTTDSGAEPFVA